MEIFWADPAKATIAIIAALGVLYGLGLFIFKVGGWHNSVNTDRENFKEFMEEVRKDLKELIKKVSVISGTLDAKSPVELNKTGQTISKELNVPSWARETAPDFVAQLKGKQPYQIQEFSFDCVKGSKSILTESIEIQAEIAAYEHGLVKSDILDVFAVELRNELLRLLAIPK
ncbi:MAG: hypothetical protein OXG10_02835 [Candidatus Dadabacteria bacterium]|nr:hypothetical protein [Candidatus Dadabacteria bacterium]